MSKIALSPNASGTGVFTIASPSGNTDRTLTLPDEAGTVLTTAGVPASAMPAGSVIQVVRAQTTGGVQAIATTTWTDLNGVTLNITPSSASSTFLLLGRAHGNATVSSSGFSFRFVRNGIALHTPAGNHEAYINTDSDWYQNINKTIIDAPATTSTLTYKLQVATHAARNVTFNYYGDGRFASELVVMEISG